jgi:hypothetical protein
VTSVVRVTRWMEARGIEILSVPTTSSMTSSCCFESFRTKNSLGSSVSSALQRFGVVVLAVPLVVPLVVVLAVPLVAPVAVAVAVAVAVPPVPVAVLILLVGAEC